MFPTSPDRPIRLATRGSALALAQATMTEEALAERYPDIDLVRRVIQTSGDRFQDRPLAEIGGKELFTKEIDEALLSGAADIAVHSLKDVPSEIPAKLCIAAVLPRADARDVLVCGASTLARIAELPPGCEVGTSSPRRALQLLLARPDLKVGFIRGNVPTRLAKAARGEVGATLLAAAGMRRLNLPFEQALSPQEMLPAVGQGIVAIACRVTDDALRMALSAINHLPSWHAMRAERAFLAALGGSCRSPIAAWAEVDGAHLTLHGFLSATDGSRSARRTLHGETNDAEMLGRELAKRMQTEVPHESFA